MSESVLSDIDAAVEAGIKIGSQKVIELDENTKLIPVPAGYTLEKHEKRADRPEATKQTVNLDTAQSFIDYFNRFADESSMIVCNIDAGEFKAYLDYHTPENAAWKDHSCVFLCKQTPEWRQWTMNDKHAFDQEKFAYFIEDHAEEIINPSPADMMEIALSLRAKKNINFNSGIRLHNGQVQLEYTETIKGEAGAKGQLEIPETIEIAVKLFDGGETYKMQARFRYRIKEGQLAMWYELIRPHKTHDAAVNDAFEFIKANVECNLIIHGKL